MTAVMLVFILSLSTNLTYVFILCQVKLQLQTPLPKVLQDTRLSSHTYIILFHGLMEYIYSSHLFNPCRVQHMNCHMLVLALHQMAPRCATCVHMIIGKSLSFAVCLCIYILQFLHMLQVLGDISINAILLNYICR